MSSKKRRRENQRGAPNPDSAPPRGRPTTAGAAPGGAATGLHHDTDLTGRATAADGVGRGGALPTGAGGGSGDSAGGLAEGPGNIGGTRNLAHGAGRPGTTSSEGLKPQGLDSPLDVDKQQLPDDAAGTEPDVQEETRATQGP